MFVLADEINRTTPKTQAALLEAMSERRVTIDTRSYELPPVWMVLATRNPIEHEGTFDLPEAMLDRCLGQCDIAPPSVETLVRIIRAPDYERQMSERLERIPSIVSIADIVALRRAIFSKTADPAGDYIYVDGRIDRYIAALVVKTWEHKAVAVGSSPRGAENLKKVATVVAYLAGYDFVAPQHVLRFIDPVLAHRIFLNPSERLRYGGEFRTADVVSEVVRSVPEPPVDAVRRREGIPRCQ